ncbi:hypothetical protein QN277_029326 [Acacia crassicarpa]|uniref:Bet v I/Major latex protein domain-containing protein n=1 Tax=Acacia crassicarpa TaxID=499986 RepID=A0AAE1J536_9FABA|nr:hypothetical protein QN277_029326 [Acacia crassicarpa]
MESKVEKLEADVHIKAPAKKFYDVLSSRTHHLANVCPDKVHAIDLHEGEWGSHGSIIIWNYVHDGKKCVAKEMVEMDKENYKMTFNVLEGDLLEDYKSFRFLMELLPQEEGTIVHWTLEYEKRKGHSPDPHTLLQFDIDMTKQVDDHLAAQPDNTTN